MLSLEELTLLQENNKMLKKLCEIYNAKKRRNLLISAETFEYLFKETDVENRTKSGLMLLAKDLANKYTFPVLIVRPKAMLSKNYVHVPKELNKAFVEKYGAYAKLQIGSTSRTEAARNSSYASDVKIYSNGNTYLVDMAKIWEDCYPDRSFGLFKKEFFEKETVIKGQRFRYSPRVKVDIQYKKEFHEICLRVAQILSTIADVFGSYKNAEVKQFTQQNFSDAMRFGKELLSPGTDGIYELSLSNAAYLSSAKGNAPVSLPVDGAEFDALLEKLIEDSALKDGTPDKMYNTQYHERWQIRW
jgi:hypothetical protein